VTDNSVLQSIDAKLNDLLQRSAAGSARFLTLIALFEGGY